MDIEYIEYLELLVNNGQLLPVLQELRPRQYTQLVISSKIVSDYINNVKYTLLKWWTNTNDTIDDLRRKAPGITIEQMDWCADYYYPVDRSINLYSGEELFYNACKAGYTPEECMKFAKTEIKDEYLISTSQIASALASGRLDVFNFLKPYYEHMQTFDHEWIYLFRHRDLSIRAFIDLIYKDWEATKNEDAYSALTQILEPKPGSDDTFKAINMSEDDAVKELSVKMKLPYKVIPLQNNFLVHLMDKCNIFVRYPYTPQYKLSKNYINTCMEMSRYNSYRYPSYDILDDSLSGNILEVINKLNTYNDDISVSISTSLDYETNSWVGYDTDTRLSKPQLARRKYIVGQTVYYIHPSLSKTYLKARGVTLSDSEDNYKVLHHWCFPNDKLSTLLYSVPKYEVPKYIEWLSEYYWPLNSTEWDPSVLIDRALSLRYSDEDMKLLIDLPQDSPEIQMNVVILCFVYNRMNLLHEENSAYKIFKGTGIYGVRNIGDNRHYNIAHMIINHMYLQSEEKLDILSRFANLPPTLLDGIAGDIDTNNNWNIAGITLNANCSVDKITKMLQLFGRKLESKLYSEELEQMLLNLEYGNELGSYFPTGLLWSNTNVLQKITPDSYIYDELHYRLGGLPGGGPITSYEQAIARGDYHPLVIGGLSDKYSIDSKYGYKLMEIPFNK